MKYRDDVILTVPHGTDYEAVARAHFVGMYGSDTLPDHVTILNLRYKARDAGNDQVTVIAEAFIQDDSRPNR